MNVSYFCRHCKKHLRQGNHTECRKILKAQDKEEHARRAKIHARCEESTKHGYSTGKAADYFEHVLNTHDVG